MSAEIVNLRRVRKAKARASEAEQAAGNRAKFGRTRVEREIEARTRDLSDRRLDGHRLQPDDDRPR